MSCCGGNCGCGASCNCGSGCKGCSMYPDLSSGEKSVARTLVSGNTASDMAHADGIVTVAGENDCKCGANCTCDPCSCK